MVENDPDPLGEHRSDTGRCRRFSAADGLSYLFAVRLLDYLLDRLHNLQVQSAPGNSVIKEALYLISVDRW